MSARRCTSSDGRLTGNFGRQGEIAKREFRRAPFRRRLAAKNGQRMTRHGFLLAQVRQQGAILGQLALRGDQLDPRARSRRDGRLHQADIALVVGDDAVQGVDLRPRRCQRHGLGGDMGGQRLIGGVQLEALIFAAAPGVPRPCVSRRRTDRAGNSPSGRPCNRQRAARRNSAARTASGRISDSRQLRPARLAAEARLRRRSPLPRLRPCGGARLRHPGCPDSAWLITPSSGWRFESRSTNRPAIRWPSAMR